MTKAEEAAGWMAAGKTNCAQSVLSAFDELGLDRETALKLALGFGGGIAHTGQTCGAVTAAIMVLGLKQGFNPANPKQYKEQVNNLAEEFMRRFKEANGSTLCRELMGVDVNTPEGAWAATDKKLYVQKCPNFVKSAVEIVEELG